MVPNDIHRIIIAKGRRAKQSRGRKLSNSGRPSLLHIAYHHSKSTTQFIVRMSDYEEDTRSDHYHASVHVGTPGRGFDHWIRTTIYFHMFANLHQARGKYVSSPRFSCLGDEWTVRLYPRGQYSWSDREKPHAILISASSSTNIVTQVEIVYRDGQSSVDNRQEALAQLRGEALEIEVRMKPTKYPPLAFIPDNPSSCKIIQDLWRDEEHADVVFKVGMDFENDADPTEFLVHRFILREAAPLLFELTTSDELPSVVELPDVSPSIFEDLMLYIYGFKRNTRTPRRSLRQLTNTV